MSQCNKVSCQSDYFDYQVIFSLCFSLDDKKTVRSLSCLFIALLHPPIIKSANVLHPSPQTAFPPVTNKMNQVGSYPGPAPHLPTSAHALGPAPCQAGPGSVPAAPLLPPPGLFSSAAPQAVISPVPKNSFPFHKVFSGCSPICQTPYNSTLEVIAYFVTPPSPRSLSWACSG